LKEHEETVKDFIGKGRMRKLKVVVEAEE